MTATGDRSNLCRVPGLVRGEQRHPVQGEVGVCWDNGVTESFFSHLKTEMYHHHDFSVHIAARTAVMEYIESWYNRRRPHANNRGLPPRHAPWLNTKTRSTRSRRKKKINQAVSETRRAHMPHAEASAQ